MSDCLVYWKVYWKESLEQRRNPHFEWHTNDKHFHNKLSVGDSLWVVTTGGTNYPYEWRLLMRIVVRQLDTEQSSYGRYHAVGDVSKSQHFDIQSQGDLTPILQGLEFLSGKKIRGSGRKIGNEIQAIRPLSADGSSTLKNYASTLPIANEASVPLVLSPANSHTRRKSNQNIRQYLIIDQEITTIRNFLSGHLVQSPSNEKLCDWIYLCYLLEIYREASELFTLLESVDVNPWYYERTKKIVRICEQKVNLGH